MSAPPLLLASTSPRRAELLRAAGIAFEPCDPGIDEIAHAAGMDSPSRLATELALAKARAVAAARPGRTVLGADTVVVLDQESLGKPRDAAEAVWMLSRLSGTSHEVLTAVALVGPDARAVTGMAATAVTFARWPAAALLAYARSGAPLDKAGAYGIQEEPGSWVTQLDGAYDTVVGLPVALVRRLLARLAAAGPPGGATDPG